MKPLSNDMKSELKQTLSHMMNEISTKTSNKIPEKMKQLIITNIVKKAVMIPDNIKVFKYNNSTDSFTSTFNSFIMTEPFMELYRNMRNNLINTMQNNNDLFWLNYFNNLINIGDDDGFYMDPKHYKLFNFLKAINNNEDNILDIDTSIFDSFDLYGNHSHNPYHCLEIILKHLGVEYKVFKDVNDVKPTNVPIIIIHKGKTLLGGRNDLYHKKHDASLQEYKSMLDKAVHRRKQYINKAVSNIESSLLNNNSYMPIDINKTIDNLFTDADKYIDEYFVGFPQTKSKLYRQYKKQIDEEKTNEKEKIIVYLNNIGLKDSEKLNNVVKYPINQIEKESKKYKHLLFKMIDDFSRTSDTKLMNISDYKKHLETLKKKMTYLLNEYIDNFFEQNKPNNTKLKPDYENIIKRVNDIIIFNQFHPKTDDLLYADKKKIYDDIKKSYDVYMKDYFKEFEEKYNIYTQKYETNANYREKVDDYEALRKKELNRDIERGMFLSLNIESGLNIKSDEQIQIDKIDKLISYTTLTEYEKLLEDTLNNIKENTTKFINEWSSNIDLSKNVNINEFIEIEYSKIETRVKSIYNFDLYKPLPNNDNELYSEKKPIFDKYNKELKSERNNFIDMMKEGYISNKLKYDTNAKFKQQYDKEKQRQNNVNNIFTRTYKNFGKDNQTLKMNLIEYGNKLKQLIKDRKHIVNDKIQSLQFHNKVPNEKEYFIEVNNIQREVDNKIKFNNYKPLLEDKEYDEKLEIFESFEKQISIDKEEEIIDFKKQYDVHKQKYENNANYREKVDDYEALRKKELNRDIERGMFLSLNIESGLNIKSDEQIQIDKIDKLISYTTLTEYEKLLEDTLNNIKENTTKFINEWSSNIDLSKNVNINEFIEIEYSKIETRVKSIYNFDLYKPLPNNDNELYSEKKPIFDKYNKELKSERNNFIDMMKEGYISNKLKYDTNAKFKQQYDKEKQRQNNVNNIFTRTYKNFGKDNQTLKMNLIEYGNKLKQLIKDRKHIVNDKIQSLQFHNKVPNEKEYFIEVNNIQREVDNKIKFNNYKPLLEDKEYDEKLEIFESFEKQISIDKEEEIIDFKKQYDVHKQKYENNANYKENIYDNLKYYDILKLNEKEYETLLTKVMEKTIQYVDKKANTYISNLESSKPLNSNNVIDEIFKQAKSITKFNDFTPSIGDKLFKSKMHIFKKYSDKIEIEKNNIIKNITTSNDNVQYSINEDNSITNTKHSKARNISLSPKKSSLIKKVKNNIKGKIHEEIRKNMKHIDRPVLDIANEFIIKQITTFGLDLQNKVKAAIINKAKDITKSTLLKAANKIKKNISGDTFFKINNSLPLTLLNDKYTLNNAIMTLNNGTLEHRLACIRYKDKEYIYDPNALYMFPFNWSIPESYTTEEYYYTHLPYLYQSMDTYMSFACYINHDAFKTYINKLHIEHIPRTIPITLNKKYRSSKSTHKNKVLILYIQHNDCRVKSNNHNLNDFHNNPIMISKYIKDILIEHGNYKEQNIDIIMSCNKDTNKFFFWENSNKTDKYVVELYSQIQQYISSHKIIIIGTKYGGIVTCKLAEKMNSQSKEIISNISFCTIDSDYISPKQYVQQLDVIHFITKCENKDCEETNKKKCQKNYIQIIRNIKDDRDYMQLLTYYIIYKVTNI